jgi:tetratricopeptide (TPR) repeat protein
LIRSFRPILALPVLLAAAFVAFGAPAAIAAPKATPSPSPSGTATPAPSPSPTATPEPLDVAIPRLQALLKTNPNDKESMLTLAQDLYSIGRPDLAIGLTQNLQKLGVKSAQVFYLEGISYAAVSHDKEAIADFETASTEEPTNISVLQALTREYMRTSRPADAERVAKRALTFNKDSEDAYVNYGTVFAAEQKYDDARTQFEAAAKLNPKDAHPIVLEAKTYQDSNAIALASQVLDRAIAVDPKSVEALAGKAEIQAQEHDVKGAIASYDQILTMQNDDADRASVMDSEAHVYAVEKMNSQADNLYRQAIANYPKVVFTHLNYGDYLAFTKDTAGAEREWTLALGPNRDSVDALGRLGDYYGQKNNLTKATEMYKRITEISPSDTRAWLAVGNASMLQKQYSAAQDAYKHAYTIARTPESLLLLAQADFLGKNYAESSLIFGALAKGSPSYVKAHPQVLYVLAQSYQKTNQKAKALDTYKQLLPYTKDGTQDQAQVKQAIKQLSAPDSPKASAPKPKATPTAKAAKN